MSVPEKNRVVEREAIDVIPKAGSELNKTHTN